MGQAWPVLSRSCISRTACLRLFLHALIAGQENGYTHTMIWLSDPMTRASALPAAWLVETTMRPASLPERSVLRRSVAEKVIQTQFGTAVEGFGLSHNTAGKPFIASMPGIGLSYATRGGLVLVVIGVGALGADIEIIEPLADIPWNVLHADERGDLSRLEGEARTVAFYRLWTAKEAFLKAKGQGLMREPSGFAMRLSGDMAICQEEPGFVIETRVISDNARFYACAVARQA